MAIRPDEPTCDELAEKELCEHEECYGTFCRQPNMTNLIEAFWPDSHERALEAADLIWLLSLPDKFRTNGAEMVHGCGTDSKGCCELVRSGREDPNQCPNRSYGVDLVAVLRAAVHAMSMQRIPTTGLAHPDWDNPEWGIADGTVLVWDSEALPDCELVDDREPSVRGAFVLTDINALITQRLTEEGLI